jgi:hypothetical protein
MIHLVMAISFMYLNAELMLNMRLYDGHHLGHKDLPRMGKLSRDDLEDLPKGNHLGGLLKVKISKGLMELW